MSRRGRKIVEKETECCVCMRQSSKHFKITDKFGGSRSETLHNILTKLNLIHYELSNLEEEVVCESCRKSAVDFYNFKIMCENQQNSYKTCIPESSPENLIRDLLEPNHYETLKNFIAYHPHSSVSIDNQNNLILKPPTIARIKKENDPLQVVFLDVQQPKVIIKTEPTFEEDSNMNEDNDPDENYEESDNNEANGGDDDDFDLIGESEEDDWMDEEADVIDMRLKSSILENILFVSRIPDDYKEKKIKNSTKSIGKMKQQTARSSRPKKARN